MINGKKYRVSVTVGSIEAVHMANNPYFDTVSVKEVLDDEGTLGPELIVMTGDEFDWSSHKTEILERL
jgi:hypothetical protein